MLKSCFKMRMWDSQVSYAIVHFLSQLAALKTSWLLPVGADLSSTVGFPDINIEKVTEKKNNSKSQAAVLGYLSTAESILRPSDHCDKF